jgi:metal-responsive CopG/Arc/MetJ family transcriptional regulator
MSDDITPTLLRIPRDMVKAIEVYWHQRQLPSRAAAIRELLAYALDRKLSDKPAKEQRR